jgi:hypothetical protein
VTTGQLLRPYVWELLLPSFVLLASIAAVLLILAVILTALCEPGSRAPGLSRGVGTMAGIVALLALVAFLAANYCDHLFAPPQILNLKLAPVPLVAGKAAEADIEVLNKSAKPLRYEWLFNGQAVEGMHTAYFRLPQAPGRYPLEVRLRLEQPATLLDRLADTASAPYTFKTFVEVVKEEAPTPAPAPVVIPCCKGGEHEAANKKCKCRKGSPATDAKPAAGRRRCYRLGRPDRQGPPGQGAQAGPDGRVVR